jgi:hypothetical protein
LAGEHDLAGADLQRPRRRFAARIQAAAERRGLGQRGGQLDGRRAWLSMASGRGGGAQNRKSQPSQAGFV